MSRVAWPAGLGVAAITLALGNLALGRPELSPAVGLLALWAAGTAVGRISLPALRGQGWPAPVVVMAGTAGLSYGRLDGDPGFLVFGLMAVAILLAYSIDHLAAGVAAAGAAVFVAAWSPGAEYLLVPVIVVAVIASGARLRTSAMGVAVFAAGALADGAGAPPLIDAPDWSEALAALGRSPWLGSGEGASMPTLGLSVVLTIGVIGAALVVAAVMGAGSPRSSATRTPTNRILSTAVPAAALVSFSVAEGWSTFVGAGLVTSAVIASRAVTASGSALPGPGQRARVEVLGMPVAALTFSDAVAYVLALTEQDESAQVCVANLHGLASARENPELVEVHQDSALVLPDGMPLVWSCHRAGAPWTERVDGTSLVEGMAAAGASRGLAHYFLGGQPGVAERLAERLRGRVDGFKCVGWESPPFRTQTPEEDEAAAFERIRASGADVVWVGLGAPRQELWAQRATEAIDGVVVIGVGAAFDFLSGTIPRAPKALQSMGLEWLFRLLNEPRRLWRRCFVEYPPLIPALLWHRPRLETLGLNPSVPANHCTEPATPISESLPPATGDRWRLAAVGVAAGILAGVVSLGHGLSATDATWVGVAAGALAAAAAVASTSSVAWFAIMTLAFAAHPVLAVGGLVAAVAHRQHVVGAIIRMTAIAVTAPWWIVHDAMPLTWLSGFCVAALPLVVDARRMAADHLPMGRVGAAVVALTAVVFLVAAGSALSVGGPVAASTAALGEARADDADPVDSLRRAVQELEAATEASRGVGPRLLSLFPGGAEHVDWFELVGDELGSVGSAAVELVETLEADGPVNDDGSLDFDAISDLQADLGVVRSRIASTRDRLGNSESAFIHLRSGSTEIGEILGQLDCSLARLEAMLELAPVLGGRDGPERFAVLIGTPSEAREIGGFLAAYAIVELSGGRLETIEVGTNEDANDLLAEAAPEPVDPEEVGARYAAYEPHVFFQNVTGSPHFPTVAETARRLLGDAQRPIDGVIYLDPYVIESLLAPFGPIVVDELDAELEPEGLAEWLFLGQYWEYPDEESRNEVVESVLRYVLGGMSRFAEAEPLPMLDGLARAAVGRNLLVYHADPAVQARVSEAGLAGEFEFVGGHQLAVITSNAGANKLDALLEESIEYELNAIDASAVQATTVISLVNRADTDRPLPPVVVHDRDGFQGRNKVMVSVYSSDAIEGILVDSIAAEFETYFERGLHRAVVFVSLEPGEAVHIEATSAPVSRDGDSFEISIGAQPRVLPVVLRVSADPSLGFDEVRVNGDLMRQRTIELGGEIRLDRELHLSFG